METENSDEAKYTWSALEYEEKERSSDWFWALGIIIVTSSIASLIFGNYFFAALLLISGVLLAFFAIRKPEIINYELNEAGLKIGNRLYPYENIKSFWVQIYHEILGKKMPNGQKEMELHPLLFIHTERAFMPIMTIPIHEDSAEDIRALIKSQNIPEVEMKEHPSEKIMEALGF